jgi:hypothetical protein
MHERIKRILKGKNEETEMENEGGGGVFRIRFSLERKSEKRGGGDISLLTISSNRLVSHFCLSRLTILIGSCKLLY